MDWKGRSSKWWFHKNTKIKQFTCVANAGRPGGVVVTLENYCCSRWSLTSIPTVMRLHFICRNAKQGSTKNCWERLAAWVRIAQFDASRRGKKMISSSRDKNEGTYRGGEGRGGPAMRPRIWFSAGREGESSARVINGMERRSFGRIFSPAGCFFSQVVFVKKGVLLYSSQHTDLSTRLHPAQPLSLLMPYGKTSSQSLVANYSTEMLQSMIAKKNTNTARGPRTITCKPAHRSISWTIRSKKETKLRND